MKPVRMGRFLGVFLLWTAAAFASVDIQITGEDYFSARGVKSWLLVPATFENFTKGDIRRWQEAAESDISFEYENSGFFQVAVTVRVVPEAKGEDWVVHIQIQEGKRYRVGVVKIEVAGDMPPLLPREDLRVQSQDYFDLEDINRDKRDLEKVYGDAGYARRTVRLRIQVKDSVRSVDVTYEVDPSYLVVFDTLIVRNRRGGDNVGEGISNSRFIRDLINLKTGDTVNLSGTFKFRTKLKSTRVFSLVRLQDSLLEGSTGRSALILRLEERVPGRLFSSVFWETLDGFGVEGGWGHRNILGRFYEGKFVARVAQRRQTLGLGLANPLLFGYRLRFDNNLELIWRQDTIGTNSPFDALYRSSLNWPLGRRMRFSSRLEFESTEEPEIVSDEGMASIQRNRILNLNWINSLSLFFLDNEFNPTRGSRFVFIWGNGGPLVDENGEFQLAQTRHNWGEVNTSYYYPFFSWVVAALRLDGGAFTSEGRTNSRRFFLGGRNSVRNRDFQTVCPETEVVGDGKEECLVTGITPRYFLTSAEARLNFFKGLASSTTWLRRIKDLQIVPFSDYGRIWDEGENLNPSGRGFDVGLGLRFPVTVFNFRLDYAVGWEEGPRWADYKIIVDLAQAF